MQCCLSVLCEIVVSAVALDSCAFVRDYERRQVFCCFISFFLYFREKEGTLAGVGGRGRGRQADPLMNRENDSGLDPEIKDPEIMT